MNRECGQRTIDYSTEKINDVFVSIPDAEPPEDIFVAFADIIADINGGAIMVASDIIPDEIGRFVNDKYSRGINHIYILSGTEKVPEVIYGKAYIRKIDKKQNGVLIIQRADDGGLKSWVFSDATLKCGLRSETEFAKILYQSFCSLFWEQCTSESCVDNKWRKPQKSPFQYIPVENSVCISDKSFHSEIQEIASGKDAVVYISNQNLDYCQDISGKDKQLIIKDRNLKNLDIVSEIGVPTYLSGTEAHTFDMAFNRDLGIVFPSEVLPECVNWVLIFEDVPSSKIANACEKKWKFSKTVFVKGTLNHSVRMMAALGSEYHVESLKEVASDYVCRTVEDYLDDDRAFDCYIKDNPVKIHDSLKVEYSITFFPPPLPKAASLHKANDEWEKTLGDWTKSIEDIGIRCDKALDKLPNPNNAAAISLKNRHSKLKSGLSDLLQSTKRISSFTVAQRENYDRRRLELDEEARILDVDCAFERYKDGEMKERNRKIDKIRKDIESMQRNKEQTADKLSKKKGELQSKQDEYEAINLELEQKKNELDELERGDSSHKGEPDGMESPKSKNITGSEEQKHKKSIGESIKDRIRLIKSVSNELKDKGISINREKSRLEDEIRTLESDRMKCEQDMAGLQAKIRDIENLPAPEKKPTEELAKLLGIKDSKPLSITFPSTILPEFETAVLYASNNQNYVAIPADSKDSDLKSDVLKRDAKRLNATICVRDRMPQQKIYITIDEDGKIIAKTSGFKGEVCVDALQEILDEDELFMSFEKTDEFNAKTAVQAKKTIRQGVQR